MNIRQHRLFKDMVAARALTPTADGFYSFCMNPFCPNPNCQSPLCKRGRAKAAARRKARRDVLIGIAWGAALAMAVNIIWLCLR